MEIYLYGIILVLVILIFLLLKQLRDEQSLNKTLVARAAVFNEESTKDYLWAEKLAKKLENEFGVPYEELEKLLPTEEEVEEALSIG